MSDDDEMELTKLYGEGAATGDLAARFGVPKHQVARVVRRRGGTVRGRGPKRLTVEQEEALTAAYVAGERVADIAGRFGVYSTTVSEVAARHGAQVRPRQRPPREFTPDEVATMAAMWHDGLSQTAIALKMGTAQVVVSRVLRSNGIEPVSRPRRMVGADHGAWKGGRTVGDGGYVSVWVDPSDPMASMRRSNGYVLEHRLAMARALGRPLTRGETVHHLNGNHGDNALSNLQLRHGQHGKGVVVRCRCCGSADIEFVEISDQEAANAVADLHPARR